MNYKQFKKNQQSELNQFPILWAFSNEQLAEGVMRFNCGHKDLLDIGMGGFIKKVDRDKFSELNKRLDNQKKAYLKDCSNLVNSIYYELNNHEYCYTYDETDTLDALGLDINDELVAECFKKAVKKYLKNCGDNI